jgi:hypothetical protein
MAKKRIADLLETPCSNHHAGNVIETHEHNGEFREW